MPILPATPMKRAWPPEPRPCPNLANGQHAGHGNCWACGDPMPPAPGTREADCDHNDIDTDRKVCRDCGQPVTDAQADLAAEQWSEQHYRAR